MGVLKKLVKKNFWLIIISLFFLLTRLYKITEIPGSVYWDEASIGYNAYSVLVSSMDEWGEKFPLHFRAFGEFKLPVYIYSVAVSEFFFGLNALAVRLPAVFFGLISVIALYLLTLKISGKKSTALIASFLFTISPWTFIFFRTGYEATAGLAFFLWGIYFYWESFKKSWLILLSTLFFLASFYSYNSFRILTLIYFGFGFTFWFIGICKKKNWKKIFIWLFSFFIFVLSLIPVYKLYKLDAGLVRLTTVGVEKENKLLFFAGNYLSHFNPDFLFFKGDINPRSQMPGMAELFWLDVLFILFGIILIVKKRKFTFWAILIALILAPIPASIAKEAPHALRSILMAPVFSIIVALGFVFFVNLFKKREKIITFLFLSFYLILFSSYFYKFITSYNSLSKDSWQYSYSQIYSKYSDSFSDFNTIYITDAFAQPYIFTLFYTKEDPSKFIATKTLNPVSDWGFSTVSSLGKFRFIKNCSADFVLNSLVFCSFKEEPSKEMEKIDTISDLNQKTLLNVYYFK